MMQCQSDTAEFDRWMTLERIARSDFMGLLFDGLKSRAWEPDTLQELAVAALCGFGNGCCYFLASAVATPAGMPIVGFRRLDGSLVHAAVVDSGTGEAADVLGRRPLAALRTEMEDAAGPVRMSALTSIWDELDPEEARILQEIAAAMPWMPRTGTSAPPLPQWARLVVAYATARTALQ
ncbi:hypothetical protein FHW79_005383 [Azospirillum sp. OGB3]|uniref:hypothetical protein n=1 Tax=Azospirillum sp. OGB3 TaxID=2587012 RepID=UPI0016068AAB|nr:hypothetical protein [Azospirillum sp. OGB3]MBB3267718.1 hypothetical protein [Azospirillum sp. OGB3]